MATMSTLSSHDLSAAVSPFFSDLGSKYMLDPATGEIAKAAGYSDGFAFYMAGRGGVLGDVDADVVYAAFAFFDRGVVRKMWERGVAVEGARKAGTRYAGAADAWGKAHISGFKNAARFNELAEKVVQSVDSCGLSLFAGLRSEPLPADPIARAYRLVTYLRELRGCLHINAVTAEGLSGYEAVLTSENGAFFAKLHGYQEPHPDVSHLADARQRAEETTSRLMTQVYERALSGEERAEFARLTEELKASVA
ncbi:MAG: evbL [Actinobacteria bacterium]|nr:evbL [Actinomycetota bacterium]